MRRIGQLRRFCILLFCAVCICSCEKRAADALPLEIVCLDVGQGDCTLLRTREGDILIDAGTEDGQASLAVSLKALGVDRLALAVFTHADEDHIGGADGVLHDHPAERVWLNGIRAETDSFSRLEETLRLCGPAHEIVRAGDFFVLGGVTVTVLAPFGEVPEGNEGSLVLAVHCGSFSMLFPGDAGKEAEVVLMQQYPASQLDFTVLHASHHGSDGAGGSEFLSAVSPEAVVISCGAGNAYGHPDGRLLARLEAVGAAIYRTDLMGEIRIRTDGNRYEILYGGE